MGHKRIFIFLFISLLAKSILFGQQTNYAYQGDSYSEEIEFFKDSPLNLPDELPLCGSEEGEIEITGKFKEIKWSNGSNSNYIVVSDTGMYYVSVFDGKDWYKDSIHVIRIPELTYRATQTVLLCEGKMPRLTGNIEAKTWLWTNGAAKWGISVSQPGEYLVASSNECYTVTDTFKVVANSGAPINLNENITTCLRNNIPLNAYGPAENYKWSNGQTGQQIVVQNGGDYTVSFKVCDTLYTQRFSVDVKARSANPIYFPNVFTPNSDHINDSFKMVGASDQMNNFQISIFNRWGILLFKSNDPNFEWDGYYKGSIVPDGVYFYGGGYRHNCSGEQYIPIEGSITIQR